MKLQLDRCSVHAGLDAQINNYYQETAKMQREQRHMHVLSHITCPQETWADVQVRMLAWHVGDHK